MCLLFETIKISYGKPQNVEYHLRRVRKSRLFFFGKDDCKDFEVLLSNLKFNSNEIYKLKVIYSKSIVDYQISKYKISPKTKIRLFELPNFNYSFKFINRSVLEEIERNLQPKEIGIITQNGYLTDATYANIVLDDGNNLYTPINCLLEGTKRAKLIEQKRIIPTFIHIDDLHKYKNLQIINAMMDLEDCVKIDL